MYLDNSEVHKQAIMYKQVMIFILANHIAVMQTEESIDGVFHSMTVSFSFYKSSLG